MSKKAVILDLDGTLVNSLPDISAAMNRSLTAAGLPVHPQEAYCYMVGNGVFNLAFKAVGERTDLLDRVRDAYMKDYALNCRENSYAYPGMTETMLVLARSGLKLCVFSNKDQADTESVIRYYYPDIPFSCVRGRRDGIPLKPDPAGALLIAAELGVSPADCWYVGDTATDMRCGNSAGMETIGVLWGFRTLKELTDNNASHIAGSVDELPVIMGVRA